jgi:hypothetical protein
MLSSATANSERRKVGGGRGWGGGGGGVGREGRGEGWGGGGRGTWGGGEGWVAEEEKLRNARSEKLLTMAVPNITSSKHSAKYTTL